MFIHMLRILQGLLSFSALVVKYRLQLIHNYLTNVQVPPHFMQYYKFWNAIINPYAANVENVVSS